MCKEAVILVNRMFNQANIKLLKNFWTDVTRNYSLYVESRDVPRTVQAFECPTKPAIYLNVCFEIMTHVVNIIVRRRDVFLRKPIDLCVDDMCYEMKRVKEILSADQGTISIKNKLPETYTSVTPPNFAL